MQDNISIQQAGNMNGRYEGKLLIDVRTVENVPISDAHISISLMSSPDKVIEQAVTNSSGMTEPVELETPPIELSLDEKNNIQPYAEYYVNIQAEGFENLKVSGIELLAAHEAIQKVHLKPVESGMPPEEIVIPDHTLYGYYPPKIAEEEVKSYSESEDFELNEVVIPEIVIVHDGVPTDTNAINHYVKYTDYIKNVVSSQIYATWPKETIIANILAVMSFTMNRIYTEWYRNKGYDFTITSSTAFDQKWINGRNIYGNISEIVDEIFNQYLLRPNIRQPIMTQYCDGKRASCPKWLTKWGTKSLGDSGYSSIDIIRNFYGKNIYVTSTELISGIPSSWPGNNLKVGSTGEKVKHMEEQLDRIAQTYTAIPRLTTEGIYGEDTVESVKAFQKLFRLQQTGIVDFRTWYKISHIYVEITRIAEMV